MRFGGKMSTQDKEISSDEFWMDKCLELARQAAEVKEVPVGAIVVHDNQIVGQAFNRKEVDQRPTAHAELLALEEAARNLSRWRLNECTLYVTLEPCIMCAGAIYQSRIKRLVYAATDPKAGAIESAYRVFDDGKLNHTPIIDSGIQRVEASKILKDFFGELRETRKQEKAERSPEAIL